MLIPQAQLDHILAEGPEQERMEGWIVDQVNSGAVLPGLYPMNAETKARYAATQEIDTTKREVTPWISIPPVRGRASARPRRISPARCWQDPIVALPAPARLVSARVAFEPGARTAWHTHPLGQTLYVIQGVGLVQAKGGPIREIRAGDTVWIPPGEKHWHGASANNAHGPYRHAGVARRQSRDLDGEGDGRGICWFRLVGFINRDNRRWVSSLPLPSEGP